MSLIAARASAGSTHVPVSRDASVHSRFHWPSESWRTPLRRASPSAAEDPEAEAVERARLDTPHAGLLEPRRELGTGVAVERGGEDPLGGHAAAQQLADALDQHRRLPAPRGRDDLQRAGARADGAQLLGVEAVDGVGRRLGLRPGPPDLTRRVQRALERVGVLEQRVDEVRRVQFRQLAVGLHEQLPAAAPHRLQDVAVQRGEIVERAQPDPTDRERRGDGDAPERGELDRLVARELRGVSRGGPDQVRHPMRVTAGPDRTSVRVPAARSRRSGRAPRRRAPPRPRPSTTRGAPSCAGRRSRT